MTVDLARVAALGALRATLEAVEGGEGDARELLARLLGSGPAPPPAPAAPVEAAEPGPVKPKRKRARSQRKAEPKARGGVYAWTDEPEESEGARLLAQLVEREGSLVKVGEKYGFSGTTLHAVKAGRAHSSNTVSRLRAALASPSRVASRKDEEGPADGGSFLDAGDEHDPAA